MGEVKHYGKWDFFLSGISTTTVALKMCDLFLVKFTRGFFYGKVDEFVLTHFISGILRYALQMLAGDDTTVGPKMSNVF